jgi:hypothetical protein
MQIQTNLQVMQHIDDFYGNGRANCSFADRMLYVIINPVCPTYDRQKLISYLEENFFFLESDEIYCRFRSRNGEYIKQHEFDKENYGVRDEMTKRILQKR